MASIRQAITKVARDLGYEGNAPRSIASAVTALGTVLGGGGSGGGTLRVTFTYDSTNDVYTADKTCKEITDAIRAGVIVTGTVNAHPQRLQDDEYTVAEWNVSTYVDGRYFAHYVVFKALTYDVSNGVHAKPRLEFIDINGAMTPTTGSDIITHTVYTLAFES